MVIDDKTKFLKENEDVKNEWLSKIYNMKIGLVYVDKKNNLKDGTTFNNYIKDGLMLFNQSIDLTPFKTREVYRRLLIDSFSIAYCKTLSEEDFNAVMENYSRNIAEYVILTNPNISFITSEYFYYKYLIINDSNLEKISGLEVFYNKKFFDKFSDKMFINYNLDIIFQISVELKQAKAKLAQAKKYTKLTEIMVDLGKNILDKIKSYNNNPNSKLLSEIKSEVGELISLRNQMNELQKNAMASSLKQEINKCIIDINSYLAKLDKKFLP